MFVATAPAQAAKLQKQKAMAASIMAKEALDEGKYKEAAAFYDKSFKFDPTEPRYLYSAARAKQKAGMLAAAEKDYAQVLTFKALSAKLVNKTRSHLLEVRSARAAKLVADLEQQKKAAEKKAADKDKADADKKAAEQKADAAVASGESTSMLAYIAIGGGVALAAGGGILYKVTKDAWTVAEDDYKKGQLTYSELKTKNSETNSRETIGAVMAGVGVAGAAVGVWMMLRPAPTSSSSAMVSPAFGGRGMAFTLRF